MHYLAAWLVFAPHRGRQAENKSQKKGSDPFYSLYVLAQTVEIELAILIGEKYRLPINATLNDMLRNTGKMEARVARHEP